MGIQPLTESQELDLILEDINKGVLNEGWWETTKYALSKLGRYKANGKILGKTQETAKSESKVRDLLMKKGNEIIQQLDKDIRGIDPEFPNNKSRVSFLRCVILIAQTYDSIVAATKLPSTDPKFLPIDAANLIITDLREYVKKFLDTDLSAVFSIMDSEDIQGDLITEDELLGEDVPRSVKMNQRGKVGKFETTRMKTLKSNRLPLVLSSLGVSLGGLSWLMNSLWGERLIEVPTEEEKIKYLKNTIGTIQPGQGLTQWLNMFEGAGLNPNSTPQQFLDAVTKVGNGDLDKGIELLTAKGGIFKTPEAAKQVLEQIKNNPDGYKNLGEMFKGNWAGTGKSIGDTLVTVPGGSVVEILAKKLTTTVLRKTLVTTTAGAAAPIVGAIGVGLMAAGVLVKVMRLKGQKESRAKTLNDLYQSLVNIKPTEENPSSGIIETSAEGENKPGGDQNNKVSYSGNDKQLYNTLKKYFKNIFNFKTQNYMGTYGKGGTSNIPQSTQGIKGEIKNQPKQEKQNNSEVKISGSPTKRKLTTNKKGGDYVDFEEAPSNNKELQTGKQPLQLGQGKVENINMVVHNVLKEFIDLKEVDNVINKKGVEEKNKNQTNKTINDTSLSANQTKLFNENVRLLQSIINMLNKFNSDDKILNNLVNKIKQNPISKVNINTLLVSDQKSLEIFISNFNKTIYSTKLNNKNIMDYLGGIGGTGINKLREVAERTPSKGDINKVYQGRQIFLKNLPIYLQGLLSILSYLVDKSKKGGFNKQTTQGTQGANQQGSNQANQGEGNQPEGNEGGETEQSGGEERVEPKLMPLNQSIRNKSFFSKK